MVVKVLVALLMSVFLVGCQSEAEARLEALQSDLQLARLDLNSCEAAETVALKEQGKEELAVWDKAAANDLDSVTDEQEWEIRRSLSEQTGIPPSQVDWKGVYQSRAQSAEAKLAGKNFGLENARERVAESCVDKSKLLDRVWKLEAEVKKAGGIV